MATSRVPVSVNISSAVDGIREVNALARELKNLRAQGGRPIGDPTRELRRGLDRTERAAAAFRASFGRLISAFAVFRGAQGVVRATVAFETLENGLKAALGSSEAATSALKFLREESQRLGVSFVESAKGFTQLAAATRGTALAGDQTREIFLAVSEAMRVTGRSSEQTSAALTAIEQIVSKGTVSAEELRGQLGERLPGAFRIAAQSVGVTTQELDKMLQRGELLAEDFLPKFAAELRRTFGPGVEEAAGSTTASFERLSNSVDELAVSLGESGLVDALADASSAIARFNRGPLKQMGENFSDAKANLRALIAEFSGDAAGADALRTGRFEERIKDELSAVGELAELESRLAEAQQRQRELLAPGGPLAVPGSATPEVRARRLAREAAREIALVERRIAEVRGEVPPAAAGTGGRTPPGDSSKLAAARRRALQQEADAELEIVRDSIEQQTTALEQALEDRLVSIAEFARRRTALDLQAIDAEAAALRQRIELERQLPADAGEEDRLRAKGQVAALEARLIVLSNRRASIEVRNAREAARAERELADALAGVREELAQLTGTETAEQQRAAIARQFRDLRLTLQAEGDTEGVSLVDRLIDVRAAQARFEQLEVVLTRGLDRIRDQESTISAQQAAGLLTELQARQQLVELQRQSAEEIERALPGLQEAAAALGPEAAARVAQWRAELQRARIVVDDVALRLRGEFQDAVTSLFDDLADGAQTAEEAFRSFARTVVNSIRRILAERFAERLLAGLGRADAGGAAGVLGFLGTLLSARPAASAGPPVPLARGGLVTGPGTGISDSVPARLSAGEYVVRSAAVRHVGLAMLERINELRHGPRVSVPRLNFADGGVVPAVASATGPTVRVVNVVDPELAADFLTSSAGERVVLNHISRNRGAVKQLLA